MTPAVKVLIFVSYALYLVALFFPWHSDNIYGNCIFQQRNLNVFYKDVYVELINEMFFQFTLLATSEITPTNVLLVLSCNGPALLFFTQYVGFIINFSHVSYCPRENNIIKEILVNSWSLNRIVMWLQMKFLIETIQSDCSTLQNPVELRILMTHINTGKRIFMFYLCKISVHIKGIRCRFLMFLLTQ